MEQVRRLGFGAAIFLFFCFSSAVFASSTKAYFGLGPTVAGIEMSTGNGGAQGSTSSMATHAVGGYRLNEYCAIEGDYLSVPINHNYNAGAKINGYGVSAVAYFPTSKVFSLFGKAGISKMHTKTGITSGSIPSVVAEVDRMGLSWALGFQLNFSHIALRYGVESYPIYAIGGYETSTLIGPNLSVLFAF